ncbi:MAG: sodium/solute symporter [Planctomycetes bacterium]|nr:sodium/solute symporter [Planctomycetota bacterium]
MEKTAKLETLDFSIVAVYLGATVALGIYFSRRKQASSEGYFLAGRDLTWPFIGLSLFATNISTEHFVGLAADGHRLGLVAGGWEWMASLCLIMLACVFAPQYLRHKVFTIPEFFEKRYGPAMRMSLTVYFLAMIVLTKVSLALFSGKLVLEYFTGFSGDSILWTIGILTAAYTLVGGLRAVIYTDFVQSIILIGGSVILTWIGLDAVGGWDGLTAKLAEKDRLDMLSMVKGVDHELPFSGYLLGNFLIGGMFYWCMDQVNVQRVLGARNLHHATSGAIFAGFLKIIPVFIFVLPGIIGFILYNERLTGEDGKVAYNGTYAMLLENLLSPGLRGVVLAALLAALMSSLSSSFNSVATLVGRDIVARWSSTDNPSTQILAGRIALVAVMVLGIFATPLIESQETLWKYLQVVTGYLSVPFAVAGLLGIFSSRMNRQGALCGVAMGILAGTVLLLDSEVYQWQVGFLRHEYLGSFLHRHFLSAVLTAATVIIVSLLSAPPPKDIQEGSFSLLRGWGELSFAHKAWIGVLFATICAVWWIFR